MAETRVVTIESILGGQSLTTHFGTSDQFRSSLGIDPSQPIDINNTANSSIASGVIVPIGSTSFTGDASLFPLMWLKTNPKSANVYAYASGGSVFTMDVASATLSALSDGESMAAATGNGAAYYDNYMYFAKDTTIARYGPLNGSPSFNGDYWVTTLSKAQLTNTTYPGEKRLGILYPNHFLHRHSDGKLYVADVVGNLGTLHYIATSKTTVEGDTDNGSTFSKLTLGYGLWPTSIESYGPDLAIALYEGGAFASREERAKIAFWDTTSTNFNKITWVEFPDQIITAMKNINGVLYVVSGNYNARGFRVSRFVGGYTFEEVWYSEVGEPCLGGAIDGTQARLLIGTLTTVPASDACVFSLGLQKGITGKGIFNVLRSGANLSTAIVTALGLIKNADFNVFTPVIARSNSSGTSASAHRTDIQSENNSNANSVFWSQVYRIGQPFKIKKIRIPLAQAMAANMTIVPKIYFDDGVDTKTLTTINNTNYPSKKNIVIRPENAVGDHNFWLELVWSGTVRCTVNLPITIEFELIDD